MTFQVNIVGSCKHCCSSSLTENISLCDSPESHNQWGRPGCPQGAAVGCSGEDAEGEANSLISQTVAMAIAGTATASPISRPSSFLLNSQVILVVSGVTFELEDTQGARFVDVSLISWSFAPPPTSRRVVNMVASRPSQVAVFSSVCCGY